MLNFRHKKITFIGESPLLLNCVMYAAKFFKNINVITKDKKISKLIPKKIIIKSNLKDININEIDYLFSIMNKQIIKKKIISIKSIVCLNFHDGYLPNYAGLFSSTWSILNCESHHGVCWHEMTEEIDRGKILLRKQFKINKDDTALTVDNKSIMLGFFLFKKIINKINKNKKLKFYKQNLRKFKYYGYNSRLKIPNYGFINFNDKLKNILKLIRSLTFSAQKSKQLCRLKLFTNKGIIIIKKIKLFNNKVNYQDYKKNILVKNGSFIVKKNNKYINIILEKKLNKKIKLNKFKKVELKKYADNGLKYD